MHFVQSFVNKITQMYKRSVQEKMVLEGELEKSRMVQNTMRNQVIQLKEMINQAMGDYARQLEGKEKEIKMLKQ